MKELIKRILKKGLHPIVTKLGYKEHSGELSLLQNFFSVLKEINFIPKHIIDVGANHGTWTRTALTYFPDAFYSMLEPQNWLKEHVHDILESNPKVTFYAVGAGSQSQSLKFTVAGRDDSSNFIFNEDDAKNAGYKQIDVDVITLNELVSKNNLIEPDIIKIDAEGFDLEVLKGASNFLGKTEIFMVEAAVVAKSIENSFLKVIEFMDMNGYELFDITDLNRPFKPRVLWLTELVFIKKNGLIDVSQVIQ
jgi:FkbM family methyltransferase